MAKILTDREMAQIINDAVCTDLIDCCDAYSHFLEDLAELICDHFGGDHGKVVEPDSSLDRWTAAFHINECVPSNGGVFKAYDTDVTWEDGVEL